MLRDFSRLLVKSDNTISITRAFPHFIGKIRLFCQLLACSAYLIFYL